MPTYNPPRYLFRRHTVLRKVKPGKKFIEIGPGNLKLSSELVNKFNEGIAIDFESSVKNIYAGLPPHIKSKLSVKIGDLFNLELSNKFDCVISCEVMEHVKDDRAFLAKASSMLNKNGQIIISVPAREKYWTIHDEVVGHYKRYEKSELIRMFREAGFTNINIYSYGFPFTNALWVLRRIHGEKQSKEKANWTKTKQTKKSGVGQIPKKYDILGVVINKYSFVLPNLVSSLFSKSDLGEGYVVVANKR